MKTQAIRLFDVFILGPAMLYAGWMLRSKPIGTFLAVSGVLTSAYNWDNYQRAKREIGE
jgi:hypothetical protein